MPRPLGPLDSVWLHLDAPNNPIVITGVVWFDRPVPSGDIERLLTERLLERFPKFRNRIVKQAVGPAWWEPDAAFDLGHHLHHARLAEPNDRRALQKVVQELMSVPIDLSRPPWQFHLVHDYRGGSALVARIHHSLVDGVTLARVIHAISDTGSPPAPPPKPSAFPPALEGIAELFAHPTKLAQRLRLGAEGAAELDHLVRMSFEADTPLRGPLGKEKRAAWIEGLPLSEVRAVGARSGCTVNDVLFASMADALGEYVRARGSDAEQIRFMVPVDLRGPHAPLTPDLGNHFSVVVMPMPIGPMRPLERLSAVHETMSRLKNSVQAGLIWTLFHTIAHSPATIERGLFEFMGRKGTGVFTNVRGPEAPVSFFGHEIAGTLVWVPQAGPLGIGLSVFSYAGQVTVGIAGDAGLLPDPDTIATGFHAAFARLSEASTTQ